MATLKNLVDETTNIKNELVTCHSNLKNNLTAKGVECSDTDKISSLIDKVEDVVVLPNIIPGNSNQMYYEDVKITTSHTSYLEVHQINPFKFDGNYRLCTYHRRTGGASGYQYLYFEIERNSSVIYTSKVFAQNLTSDLESIVDITDIKKGDIVKFYTKSASYSCVFSKVKVMYDFEI